MIVACNPAVLQGQEGDYVVVDWKSFKLPRISRSSLHSEAQAASAAQDALEYVKCFWATMLNPDLDPLEDASMHGTQSALVVDAKALYDATKKDGVQGFLDKRTGIEILSLREHLEASQTQLKWVSSEMQFGDGLTKPSARQVLADRIRKSMLVLVHDPNFVAAKKKTAEERSANVKKTTAVRGTKRSAQVLAVFSCCAICNAEEQCGALIASSATVATRSLFAEAMSAMLYVILVIFAIIGVSSMLLYLVGARPRFSYEREVEKKQASATHSNTVPTKEVGYRTVGTMSMTTYLRSRSRFLADTQGFREGGQVSVDEFKKRLVADWT